MALSGGPFSSTHREGIVQRIQSEVPTLHRHDISAEAPIPPHSHPQPRSLTRILAYGRRVVTWAARVGQQARPGRLGDAEPAASFTNAVFVVSSALTHDQIRIRARAFRCIKASIFAMATPSSLRRLSHTIECPLQFLRFRTPCASRKFGVFDRHFIFYKVRT